MTPPTRRTFLERARAHRRDESDAESGSLVLDILIGMAIFALVAIIAVSAVGQYRMRAYIQTAMSDAEATANAVNAAITDRASDPAAGTYPTGLLTPADLALLEVTPTGRGANTSAVTVIPSATNPEHFTVCVEHRGAYAEYFSNEGLVASGSIADDNYLGCDPDDNDDGGDGGNGGDDSVEAPINISVTVDDDTATVTWDPVDGADSYLVHLDDDATPAWTGDATTAVLPGLPAGEHTVTVTATDGGTASAPSAPETFTVTTGSTTTPVDWTGYPDDLTGYGADNSTVPCPTLIGVESWHRWMGEYNFLVTFDQTLEDYKATHTTTSGYRYQYRAIKASTGEVGIWNYSDHNGRYRSDQGWGIVPGGDGVEGDVFYLEVSGRASFSGARSAKCNSVGKFTLRYTPNWTNGTVQTLDNTTVDVSRFTPNTSPVPCPVLTDAATWRDLYDDHASVNITNRGAYQPIYRIPGQDWYNARGDGHRGAPYVRGVIARDAPAGSEHIVEFMLEDTTTGFRSENCTAAVRLYRTPSSVEMFATKPIDQVTVRPFW